MDAQRPNELIARAEVHVSPDEAHIKVAYHWSGFDYQNPPPDEVVDQCFRHGTGARSALASLAASAWGTSPGGLMLSSPEFLKHPALNYFAGLVR